MDCAELKRLHAIDVQEGFHCRALNGARLLVVTPYQLPDGDLIEVAIDERPDGTVRVRDLGETISSLLSQGFDPQASEKRKWLLDQAARLTGIEIDAGELRKDGGKNEVGALILDVAAAARAVGDLIYLHRSQDPQDFESRVITFLADHARDVEPKAKVVGVSGHVYRITARVFREDRPPLLVSTLAPRSASQMKGAVDRVVRQWVDVNHEVVRHHKVSFLNDLTVGWRPADVRLLDRFSLVTGWRTRHALAPVVEGALEEPAVEREMPLWEDGGQSSRDS